MKQLTLLTLLISFTSLAQTEHPISNEHYNIALDADLTLTYHGQLDDSRPGNDIPVTGKDLRNAIDCVIEGKNTPEVQKPSIGCSIKWK